MNCTVFLTIFSGVLTFVIGQVFVKLVIEPVHELKKTLGQISHALIEHANVIANPGVPSKEVIDQASKQLRGLSSQLHAHLYLVPLYVVTARIFFLPSKQNVREASTNLIGLSNSLSQPTPGIYEQSARRIESICDGLGIFMADGDRWPK
jgi:hypothetical protein